jgi:hypothetical protein
MKKYLKNKLSVLFIFSHLLILINLVILIFDFKTIIDPRSLGITALIIGLTLGLFGLIVNFILVKVIRNKLILNITEVVMILAFLYWVWPR